MRFKAVVAVGILVLSATISVGAGGIAPNGSVAVTIVDAATPTAGHAVPMTVCLDGTNLAVVTTGMRSGPYGAKPGTHVLQGFTDNQDCTGTPAVTETIDIPVVDAVTVMIGWKADGKHLALYVDDPTCTPPSHTRVVVRNGGDTSSTGQTPRLVGRAPDASTASALTPTVDFGEQSVIMVPSGTFNAVAVMAGTTTVESFGTMVMLPGTVVEYYVYGGAEGASGAFSFVRRVNECATPAATTIPPVTPSEANPSSGATDTKPGSSTNPDVGLRRARPATPIRTVREPTYIG